MKRNMIVKCILCAVVAKAAMADVVPEVMQPGVSSVATVWLCLFVLPMIGISLLIAILKRFISSRSGKVQKSWFSMYYIIFIVASIPLAYFITVVLFRGMNRAMYQKWYVEKEKVLCGKRDQMRFARPATSP